MPQTFYRLPDGGIGGAWPEPGDRDGPPDESWHPVTGTNVCPEGWSLRPDATCDPRVATECPPGSDPLPGGRCTATAECASEPWPAPVQTGAGGRVVRVRAGASEAGADGSSERPFGTLQAAMTAAGEGGVVLVTDGVYPETVAVTRTVTILGRCATRVRIEGREPVAPAAVQVHGDGVSLTLRGVALVSESRGIHVTEGARLNVRGVRFEGTRGDTVRIEGSMTQADIEDVAILRARQPDARTAGFGFSVFDGARATLRRASVTVAAPIARDGLTGAVRGVGEGTRVEVRDLFVVGEPGAPAESKATGIVAAVGGVIDAERVVSRGFQGTTLDSERVTGEAKGTALRARDVVCLGRADTSDRVISPCIQVGEGASLSVDRFTLGDGAFYPGPVLLEAGALTLTNGVIQNVSTGADPAAGEGISVVGGSLSMSNTRLSGLARSAIHLFGGVATLDDVAIRDVRRDNALVTAVAIGGEAQPASLTARRVEVAAIEGYGLTAAMGATVSLSDSVLRSLRPPAVRPTVTAISAGGGARVEVARTLITEIQGSGVSVLEEGTNLSIARSIVRNLSRPSEMAAPGGLYCGRGAVLSVVGSVVSDVRTGISAGFRCRLDATDTIVSRTLDPRREQGTGIALAYGAAARLRRVLVQEAGAYGVFVGASAQLDAEDLVVRNVRGSFHLPGGGETERPFMGAGCVATAEATMTLRRVAIERVGAAALLTGKSFLEGGMMPVGRARVTANEVFIRDVEARSLADNLSGESPPISLGAYTCSNCSTEVRNGTFERLDVGFQMFSPSVVASNVVMDGVRCAVQTTERVTPSNELLSQIQVRPPGALRCVSALSDEPLPVIDLGPPP